MVVQSKSNEVANLLICLRLEKEKGSIIPDDRVPEIQKCLERLKVLGRDPNDASEIFSTNGIETLAYFGFVVRTQNISREALRCLANALFLKPSIRQSFIDLGFAEKTAEKYRELCEYDDEFLCARILLLLTYEAKLNYNSLIEGLKLSDSIARLLKCHVTPSANPMDSVALSEALKLTYNLLHHNMSLEMYFQPMLSDLLKLLMREKPSKDSAPSQCAREITNVLLNLELTPSIMFPDDEAEKHVSSIIDTLEIIIKAFPAQDLDAMASPSISLLRRILQVAPRSSKDLMKQRLLPSAEERHKPLGQSEKLSSRLLQLSVSAYTPILRDEIPHLLFELSNNDAEQFVRNVGYGYASGFLTNNNIPAPQPDGQAHSREGDEVNFVTGQYVRDQPQDQGEPMTEEEKMREAERLFVLFERLKQTGVMNVQNPVEAAVQSGRFEELD